MFRAVGQDYLGLLVQIILWDFILILLGMGLQTYVVSFTIIDCFSSSDYADAEIFIHRR